MRYDVIDTCTARLRKTSVAEWRWIGSGCDDEVVDVSINLFSGRSYLE